MSDSPDTKALFDGGEVKTFKQERARRTYEALVEAATDLFAKSGFDATQSPDIATAAGVSVGTFYRYFDDKKEIFLEVQRRFLRRSYGAVIDELNVERFVGRRYRDITDECLVILRDHATREPGLVKALVELSIRDDDVAELRRQFDNLAHHHVTLVVTATTDRERVPDPEAMAFVIVTIAIEMAILFSGIRGPTPVSEERARDALASLVHLAFFHGTAQE